MKKILTILFVLTAFYVYPQHSGNKQNVKTIILDDVIVYPVNSKTVQTPNKLGVRVAGKGFSSIISSVSIKEKRSIKIDAIEFYFNCAWGDSEKEGFYVKPLIYTSESNKPKTLLYDGEDYYVTRKVGQKIYMDLSKKNIVVNNPKQFYIGLEIVDVVGKSQIEDFNLTMIELKQKQGATFIKGSCSKCNFTPFSLAANKSLSLKYKLFYTVL